MAEWFKQPAADRFTEVQILLLAPRTPRQRLVFAYSTKSDAIMIEKAVEATFVAMFALIDLRQIFRDTKPTYQFTDEQHASIQKIMETIRQSVTIIEEEMRP